MMKKIYEYRLEIALLFLSALLYQAFHYYLLAEETYLRFLLSAIFLLDLLLIILILRVLWRTRWKKMLAAGMQKAFSAMAKFIFRFFEKLRLSKGNKKILTGKTTVSFDFSTSKKEAKPLKPLKWKQLQSDRERLRYIYGHMISDRIREGFAAYSYETPEELRRKGENKDYEEQLFSLYIDVRYDERLEPQEEAVRRLKDQCNIKG